MRDNTSGDKKLATRLLWMNIGRQDFKGPAAPQQGRDNTSTSAQAARRSATKLQTPVRRATRLQAWAAEGDPPRQDFKSVEEAPRGATTLQVDPSGAVPRDKSSRSTEGGLRGATRLQMPPIREISWKSRVSGCRSPAVELRLIPASRGTGPRQNFKSARQHFRQRRCHESDRFPQTVGVFRWQRYMS